MTLGAARQPLVRDVLLRDGSTLRLQVPSEADLDDITAFYGGLSEGSRYLRFHGYPRIENIARADVEASGVDRLTLIGRHGGRVVAIASYDGLREKGVAEVAFAVADDLQQRGIGMRMLEQLAAIAAERGIHRFDAEVIAHNQPMLRVFERAGFAVRRRSSFGEVTVSLDITPTDAARERIGERDHFASVAALQPFLAPASIAVAGAAAAAGNVGQAVLANIITGGFHGIASAVHRDGGVVCSMLAARRLEDLPVAPELVIIAAGGEELLDYAAEAAGRGARALLVLPAGPDDGSEQSSVADERLLEIVRDAGLRMVGPSSLGVLNTASEVRVNATFSGAAVRAGGLAIGSHALALGFGLLGHAAARQLGVSVFISLGSRADVSTSDLLEWCEEDQRTAAVMLDVDTFGDPARFTRVAQRVAREKPILVVKGRRRGARPRLEASSQTALALRGDAVFDAVLHHAGVLRFRSGEELFQAAELFESQPLPRGREVGIVTNSPGVAMLAADACTARGLNVSQVSESQNPMVLGVGAGPREYAASITELLSDTGIDAVMVSYVDRRDGDPEGVLGAISAAATAHSKPVVASVVRADGRLPRRDVSHIPNFLFPESCGAALARAAERRAWLSRPLGERPYYRDLEPSAARDLIESSLHVDPDGGWLALGDLEGLLATYGIPFARSVHCADIANAVAAARAVGGPVAIKAHLVAPAHASEIHAVLLGLEGESAVRAGWRELQRRVQNAGYRWSGAVVQRLEEPGADVLVGALRDPDLGPVIAVGLGGRQAGFGKSAAFRLPPATDVEADELIDACEPVAAELDGLRGAARLARHALREVILRFALLVNEVPEIVEADLNSVRCTTTGCAVLDMRMRTEPPTTVERLKTW